jgi:hypothetical protein
VRCCFAEHAASGRRVAEWEALMKGLQRPPLDGQPDECWTLREPVFRLEPLDDASAAAGGSPR